MTEFFKRKSTLLLLFIISGSVVLSRGYPLRSDAAPAQDDWSKPAQKAPQKKAAAPDAKSAASLRPVAAHSETKAGQKMAALREIKVLPSDIPLTGPRASQRLVVEALFDDGHQEDVTAQAKVSSSSPQVAALDLGFVKPASDGEATLRASFQGHEATAQVRVKDSRAPFVWSFRNHV